MILEEAQIYHVEAMHKLQMFCYDPSLWESIETFENIVQHKMSWVCQEDGIVIAYMISHMVGSSGPPKLNSISDCKNDGQYLIHDLLVHPDFRSKGIASLFLTKISYPCTLISLPSAYNFWKRMGFIDHPTVLDEEISKSYGDNVHWMIKYDAN